MCRLFGIINLRERESEYDTLLRGSLVAEMANRLTHGGPDEQAIAEGSHWTMGVDRLSIMDVQGGSQPFYDAARGVCVFFNGEIYNYRALRAELEGHGYRFRSQCDGEVLPYLYTLVGEAFLKRLDGMFSLALWDARHHRLLLSVDHLGIKPLFYTIADEQLIFASELNALFVHPQVIPQTRLTAIASYLSLKAIFGRHVREGYETAFQGIYALPPGGVLTWDCGHGLSFSRHTCWDTTLETQVRNPSEHPHITNESQALDLLIDTLDHEVDTLTNADVALCVTNSGGLDSALVAALATRYTPYQLKSFTIGYGAIGDWPADERPFAREVAKVIGTSQRDVILAPHNIPKLLPLVTYHLGQPNADPIAVSSFALFASIKAQGFKVVLAGDGSDEIFGGYSRFLAARHQSQARWIPAYLEALAAVPKAARQVLCTSSLLEELATVEKNLTEKLSSAYHSRLPDPSARSAHKTAWGEYSQRLDVLTAFELTQRLPIYHLQRVDHMSAAHGLEVRVPYCQRKVVSLAMQLAAHLKVRGEQGKAILYRAAAVEALLPPAILARKKQPFTLPIGALMQTGLPLERYAREVLLDEVTLQRGYFRREALEELFSEKAGWVQQSRQAVDHSGDGRARIIWSLLTLELWHRIYIDPTGSATAAPRHTQVPAAIGSHSSALSTAASPIIQAMR